MHGQGKKRKGKRGMGRGLFCFRTMTEREKTPHFLYGLTRRKGEEKVGMSRKPLLRDQKQKYKVPSQVSSEGREKGGKEERYFHDRARR